MFFCRVAHDKGFNALHSEDMSHWETLSTDDMLTYEGSSKVMASHTTLSHALKVAFPEQYSGEGKRQEKMLDRVIRELFSKYTIVSNARKDSGLVDSTLRQHSVFRELDVWIPELKLGFEYQVC